MDKNSILRCILIFIPKPQIFWGWIFYQYQEKTYNISSYSFRTLARKLLEFSLHNRKTITETPWIFQGFPISKKNSCRGNYNTVCTIFEITMPIQKLYFPNHAVHTNAVSSVTVWCSVVLVIQWCTLFYDRRLHHEVHLFCYINTINFKFHQFNQWLFFKPWRTKTR